MKETELAQKFVDYLSCYDLYFEVDYAGHSIDIVAIEGRITLAVEVKTTFNFKVLEQAIINRPYFNYSYIGVPDFKDGFFQKDLCRQFGIGLLVYDSRKGYFDVREVVSPKLMRIKSNSLIDRLCAFQKLSKPGSKSGDGNKITAFQLTVENLKEYVRRHPGCTFKEMTAGISHHYKNNALAINNISAWIRNGIISEIVIKDRKMFLQKG